MHQKETGTTTFVFFDVFTCVQSIIVTGHVVTVVNIMDCYMIQVSYTFEVIFCARRYSVDVRLKVKCDQVSTATTNSVPLSISEKSLVGKDGARID